MSSVSLNLELEKFTGFDREQICREVVAYDGGAFQVMLTRKPMDEPQSVIGSRGGKNGHLDWSQ